MKKKGVVQQSGIILSIFVLMAVFYWGFSSSPAFADNRDPQMTGLPELTEEQLDWQNKHMLRVKKVKINQIGLQRINEARSKKGLGSLTGGEVSVYEIGSEIEAAVGATSDGSESVIPEGEVVSSVDNSQLKYFPPISTQGSLPSCGAYSGTYYAMTYMLALVRDLDAKSGGAALRCSPKWTYNIINGGQLVGSWYYQAYDIGMKHGCATMAEFPYVGSTSSTLYYREWSRDPVVWRNSIDRKFDTYGYVADTDKDAGIQLVKNMLLNGYILNFPTYIYSWQWKTIADDPSTTADDAFVGKNCAYWVNGTSGYHAMTVVGYNDDIWVDINGNGSVDDGEKGAFRIANSWGTGWQESGFAWMAYDALKNPSAVSGGPSVNRILGWSPARAHWVTATASYQPAMVAQFTMNHLKRNQLRVTLGTSDPAATSPSLTWLPKMIYAQGGAYAFDGSTTAIDGTFVFDFTDIAPTGTQAKKYYLGLYDSTTGDSVELSSYKLIDVKNGNTVTESFDVPKVVDAGQAYAYVDYVYNDGNIAPTAVISSATPPTGDAPLTVTFDGSQSYDTDGTISTYFWSFGDGGTASGAAVSHIYMTPGNYTASLTVYDNRGATDSEIVAITVTPPPLKAMYISDIAMSISSSKAGTMATAKVTVVDEDGQPVPNATVGATWSGLISGTASAVTGADGTASINSGKTKKSGTFTITVTGLTVAGYNYDAAQNVVTSASISSSGESVIDDEEDVAIPLRITDIVMDLDVTAAGAAAVATVQVVDEQGNPVQGATVTGQWSGLVAGEVSGMTDVLGQASFLSKRTKKTGQFVFSITGVFLDGYTYDVQNSVTQKSVDSIN